LGLFSTAALALGVVFSEWFCGSFNLSSISKRVYSARGSALLSISEVSYEPKWVCWFSLVINWSASMTSSWPDIVKRLLISLTFSFNSIACILCSSSALSSGALAFLLAYFYSFLSSCSWMLAGTGSEPCPLLLLWPISSRIYLPFSLISLFFLFSLTSVVYLGVCLLPCCSWNIPEVLALGDAVDYPTLPAPEY
jgi:hypothetical protein